MKGMRMQIEVLHPLQNHKRLRCRPFLIANNNMVPTFTNRCRQYNQIAISARR